MFPTKSYHRHERNVHSLFRCEGSDADKPPAVSSSGGLCSTTFSHCLFTDKFYALQNGPPNISLQILTLTTLRNDLVPSRTPFPPAPSPTSLFLPSWDGNPAYGGQDPSGLDICSSTCQYSGKSEIWDVPNVMIGLGFINDDPVRGSDAKPRRYHFLKEQNQRASHFMINANIHDDPVWATLLPLCSQRAGYGRSDIGQQSSTRHADWCDQYSHFLLSLLTCLRPTSSPPHIAEVQEPSATLPPSALNAATPNPVLPPSLPCTEATPMPTQEPVLSFLPRIAQRSR